MLKVGDQVPDFTLGTGSAEGRGTFTLAKELGRGDLLFQFYPLAFTRTCTQQVCDTRDAGHFFEHVGARPFGFSTDTVPSNAAFAREQKLTFPLISDPNREVVDRIWATEDTIGVKRVAKRGWMIVDATGRVKALKVFGDADEWTGLQEAAHVLHAGHHH